MSSPTPFPALTVGELVYVNSQRTTAGWRPAFVTAIFGDNIQCSVLIQEGIMGKWSPHENVRWFQDARLLTDPQFAAQHADNDEAGVFKLSDARVLAEQKEQALLAAIECLANGSKEQKEQAARIVDQLQGVKPELTIKPAREYEPSNDWRLSKKPTKVQTAEERAAVLAAAE